MALTHSSSIHQNVHVGSIPTASSEHCGTAAEERVAELRPGVSTVLSGTVSTLSPSCPDQDVLVKMSCHEENVCTWVQCYGTVKVALSAHVSNKDSHGGED